MEGVRGEEGDDDGGLARGEGGEFGGKRGYGYDELVSFRMDSDRGYGADWQMCTRNVDYVSRLESSSLDGGGSDHRSGPPNYSGNDVCSVVEELTVNNCGIASADGGGRVEVGLRDERLNGKRSHWQHLYKLTGSSKRLSKTVSSELGRIVLNAREGLKRMSSDNQSMNLTSGNRCSRDPDEVSAQLMNGYNKIISNSSTLQEALRRKALVSPHLAQYFASNVSKGKGVISSKQNVRTRLAAPGMECEDVGLSSETAKHSKPRIIDECSPLNSEGSAPQIFNKHVILRKWLRPCRYKLNKIESLDIYRKILELVDAAHSQGFILGKLRPSYFKLEFPNTVKYIGPLLQTIDTPVNNSLSKKRLFADDLLTCQYSSSKHHKVNLESSSSQSRCDLRNDFEGEPVADVCQFGKIINHKFSGDQGNINPAEVLSCVSSSMEEQWYSSPEELNGIGCTFSTNTYALGVLFFELLCCSRTPELLSAAMMNLRNRVLPPALLSEYPKEVGFCLWLLHPDASLRPSVREILESDVLCQHQKSVAVKAADLAMEDGLFPAIEVEDTESELMLHFLTALKEQKESQVSKLKQNLEFLCMDLQDVERRNAERMPLMHLEKGSSAFKNAVRGLHSKSSTESENRLFAKNKQIEDAYFSIRSKMQKTEPGYERPDKDVLKGTDNWLQKTSENDVSCMKDNPHDELGVFFEGLCKFASYNKFEERGTLRSGDLLNSANVVCSISFDREEDFIATAWVSKKIKIFGFDALLNDPADIHYPVAEMSNKSMLSCVCWNSYIKNYLASTDYDGTVQMWDANTSQAFCQYSEHQKRAWSVDFSKVDPRKFATGSDDYLVKIWSINERNSTITIRNPANICCVQFSPASPNLVAFGSADYKLHCYDLRHTRIPWCTLADHDRTVSHVKFLDSDTIVSASTDNTLKLWDLKKTSPAGISSSACSLTYRGHTNQKNFVGLSVSDGFIACGSETNEVFAYHKSLPMPITSYKFSSVDAISGRKMRDDISQFVSSVCWRRKSNMILAANSKGNIKLLQMVSETT